MVETRGGTNVKKKKTDVNQQPGRPKKKGTRKGGTRRKGISQRPANKLGERDDRANGGK